MSNIDCAAAVLRNTNVIRPHRGMDANASGTFAQALADAGLLAPAPRIIRTPAELEALDPDTVLQPPLNENSEWPRVISAESLQWAMRTWGATFLPAVVVTTGEHVRTCREALEGGTV
ncbi:hypothetical protein AALF15_01220 [Corynebacteriaceae bacterium 7-707]